MANDKFECIEKRIETNGIYQRIVAYKITSY